MPDVLRKVRPGPVLILLTVLVFAPVLWHDFVNFDDPVYVLDNPIVADGLTWSGVVRAFTTTQAAYWHPLTWLSHMADIELFGLRPGPHHLVNVLMHVFSTLLLFGVITRMTGLPGRAAFVAAIFAVHPLRVESVAWVAERKDVLSTLLWMLALTVYVEYVKKPGRGPYLASLGLFALGLLAKPMVLTLPLVLCLLDVWPLRRITFDTLTRGRVTPLLVEKVPFVILSMFGALVTLWAQHGGGAVKSLELFPISQRIGNALVSYVAYLGMFIWPVNLAVFYPSVPVPAWQVIGAVGVLGAISWSGLRAASRSPYLAVGWLWYLITLFPVIGLVQAGMQSRADRFLYVPHIGISLAVAWGLPELLRSSRARTQLLPAAAAVVVLIYAGMAHAYVRTWRDSETMWRRALSVTTGNYMAHHNLGVMLSAQGRTDEALTELEETLRIWPDFPEAHNTLGNLLAKRGDDASAVAHYRTAVRLSPGFAAAHNNLGLALVRQGAIDEAVTHYLEALKLSPGFVAAHHNLGRAFLLQGHAAEAEAHLREAIRLKPRYTDAHVSLGELFAGTGQTQQAASCFREALRLDPTHAKAQSALARLTADRR
ncbi:MAG TPA: tetratricopeptide repeat protein [Vicinamibacterales bacterium]|nr:tetratricopeptide repeat protein [Vicinamibacterales bacterium]